MTRYSGKIKLFACSISQKEWESLETFARDRLPATEGGVKPLSIV